MYTLRYLFTMFLLLLCGFAGSGQTHTKANKHPQKVRPITINDDYDFYPKVIPASSIGMQGTRVSSPFVPTKALQALFPGKYRNFLRWIDSGERINIVAWISKEIPRKRFQNWDDMVYFPHAVNVTELRDTLHYTDKAGNRYILMSFATRDGDNCLCMSCGRFVGVMMGLALFKETGSEWQLETFDMALGFHGAFQELPRLHSIQLGPDKQGWYFYDANGGGGSVYYAELYVISVIDGRFKEVMAVPQVKRYNTPSSVWDVKIKVNKQDSTNAFWPMQLAIKGTFIRYTPDPVYDSTDSPPELAKQIKGRDRFDFTLYRKYEFRDNKYRKTGSSVKIR